ncbi:MAG: flagellar biosynthesis protein FlhF [Gammaproteobacteria bacterium]|nr:flagellar biosynthesis protein FlhF [Gammaproteobacteria bacterium]
MKIKRFTGSDMRQAIRKVRDALGPDAVILSNRTVDEGVEVVAAIDYDESLLDTVPGAKPKKPAFQQTEKEINRDAIWDDVRYARNIPAPAKAPAAAAKQEIPAAAANIKLSDDPNFQQMQSELKSLRGLLVNQLSGMAWENETKYHPLRARLLQRLIALGLSPQLARDITERVDEQDDFDHNWRMALGLLAHRLPVHDDIILNQQKVIIAVVGPTGVGKTTTVAKLAARYLLRHGKRRIGLITTDNYRVAAHEQLRAYARIMGAPMRVATDVDSLQDALAAFHDKDLVLIDTAGMSQRDMRLNEQFSLLKEAGHNIKVYLTLAANSQRGVLADVVRAFRVVPLAGCILTKVDETTSLGGGLSVAAEQNLPVAYISDGQQVPEDLHPARAHSLVSRAVAIMQDVGVGAKDDPISTMIGGMAAHAHG